MSAEDDLYVDIYYDEYPKPVLVGTSNNNVYDQPKTIDTDSLDINSPKCAIDISQNVVAKSVVVLNDDDRGPHEPRGVCHVMMCMLICIGIGIACVVVALEENQPSDTQLIYLEGNIIFVFYLGVGILCCIGLCLSAAACAQCCDVCLVVFR